TVEANAGAGHGELAARPRFGPDPVARGERRVDDRLGPVDVVTVVERNAAVGEGEPSDCAGRAALGVRDAGKGGKSGDKRQARAKGMSHGWFYSSSSPV